MPVVYCKRCGRQLIDREKCDVCGAQTYKVPEQYLSRSKMTVSMNLEQKFIDECIKSSPEFRPYYYEKQKNFMSERMSSYASVANAPKCPSCGSTNISKIGTISRAVSTGIFGLASSKIGKTHKCNNCGTTW